MMKKALLLTALILTACSPRIVERIVEKEVVSVRIIRDTALVEIPHIIEKNVTLDTMSHLENKYAKSDAMVSDGMLSHTLESIPQIIKVPVEIPVHDTLKITTVEKGEIVQVEKPLSFWQRLKIGAFWWLCGAILLCLLWIFRKTLFKIF